MTGIHALTKEIAHGFARPMAPVGSYILGVAVGARAARGEQVDPAALTEAIRSTFPTGATDRSAPADELEHLLRDATAGGHRDMALPLVPHQAAAGDEALRSRRRRRAGRTGPGPRTRTGPAPRSGEVRTASRTPARPRSRPPGPPAGSACPESRLFPIQGPSRRRSQRARRPGATYSANVIPVRTRSPDGDGLREAGVDVLPPVAHLGGRDDDRHVPEQVAVARGEVLRDHPAEGDADDEVGPATELRAR